MRPDRALVSAVRALARLVRNIMARTTDHQSARRRAALCMFIILVIGVGLLVTALMVIAPILPKDQFVGGIILTAIAGAISSFLSFIGLIVKGLVDNLTRDEPTQ